MRSGGTMGWKAASRLSFPAPPSTSRSERRSNTATYRTWSLKFICVTMPPWPGESEAAYVEGSGNPRSDG